MVKIIFESHGTSFDNEAGLASGWSDIDLSPLGEKQAKQLGQRYKAEELDVVFCSDLKRSWRTANLAFGGSIPIVQDSRLRECDYGEFTKRSASEIDRLKGDHVFKPWPGGRSYQIMADDMKAFLSALGQDYSGKIAMIIGSRATQYALEHWIRGVPLYDAVVAPWKWQPGWTYHLG